MELATFRGTAHPTRPGGARRRGRALAPTEAGFLASFEKLRKRHPPALAKAAASKRSCSARQGPHQVREAERMYFTREALEQATGEVAARHRARASQALASSRTWVAALAAMRSHWPRAA